MENSMYSHILKQMREAVRLRHYVVTLHALEEMDDDDFSMLTLHFTRGDSSAAEGA